VVEIEDVAYQKAFIQQLAARHRSMFWASSNDPFRSAHAMLDTYFRMKA
jgi:hypothetical protein